MTDSFCATSGTQRGAALVIGLVILTVVTMLSVTAMLSNVTQEKMAYNLQDRQKALQAADSATRYAWSQLSADPPAYDVGDFIDNNVTGAPFPALYDLRSSGTVSGSKQMAEWQAILSPANWPWNDASKRGEIPSGASVDANSDPMALAIRPQFAIGMYAPVERTGSEVGRKCVPYSIIGAGQGSETASQALVNISVIPKSGCFVDEVVR